MHALPADVCAAAYNLILHDEFSLFDRPVAESGPSARVDLFDEEVAVQLPTHVHRGGREETEAEGQTTECSESRRSEDAATEEDGGGMHASRQDATIRSVCSVDHESRSMSRRAQREQWSAERCGDVWVSTCTAH